MGMEVFGTDKTILVDNDHMEPVDLLHSKHQHHCLDLQVPPSWDWAQGSHKTP